MAEVKIVGNNFVVVSTITEQVFDNVSKYRKAALKNVDEEGNDVFSVAMTCGRPSISSYGIEFNAVTNCENKFLMATYPIPSGVDAKEYVTSKVRNALPQLAEVEGRLGGIDEEITAETKAVAAKVSVLL